MSLVQHDLVQEFELMGNHMKGLSVPSRGARQLEVWLGRSDPGCATPVHSHSDEEVLIALQGRGEMRADGAVVAFQAPCTLIAPARQQHQLANTGDEMLVAIAVVPVGSKVYDADGNEMLLPWRD